MSISELCSDLLAKCRSLSHEHVAAVSRTVRSLGLEHVLAPHPSASRNSTLAMVLAGVLRPLSEMDTTRSLQEQTRSTSLDNVLQVADFTEIL